LVVSNSGRFAVVLFLSVASVSLGDKESPELAKFRPLIERSVSRGLAFLAKQQLTPQQASSMGSRSLAGAFEFRRRGSLGISALCVKAFLSKGHTPGHGPYGQVINRGIDFLLSYQEKGVLMPAESKIRDPRGKTYSHSIATLVLAEVSGMVDASRQSQIDRVLPQAVGVLVKAQQVHKDVRHRGGWRYEPHAKDADLSLSGWALMALRASKINGATVPQSAIRDAVGFVLRCHNQRDGGFSYIPSGGTSTLAMSGAALLCLNLCGEHQNKSLKPAGEHILRQMNARHRLGSNRFIGQSNHGYYAAYYCFQGMFQLGGFAWETWAKTMYPNLIHAQMPDGSWPASYYGHAYATAMCVLSMTVSYRQLPIYQRHD
jgi:hypothetical protein